VRPRKMGIQRNKVDKHYHNHFHSDLFLTCFTHPIYWCCACICPCCFACKQRYDILDGDITDYKCCGGAYGNCSCGGEMCPPVCLCLETWFCCWCAIFGNRWLIQNMYQIHNTAFETCIFWTACICSWVMCIISIIFGIPRDVELLCDVIYCAFSACIQSQNQAELDYQRKGPKAQEMTTF